MSYRYNNPHPRRRYNSVMAYLDSDIATQAQCVGGASASLPTDAMDRFNPPASRAFDVFVESDKKLVTLRLFSLPSDRDVDSILTKLQRAAIVVEKSGPFRLLWDNRMGIVIQRRAIRVIRDVLEARRSKTDRIAILAAPGLPRAQALQSIGERDRVFICEEDAIGWLRASDPLGSKRN